MQSVPMHHASASIAVQSLPLSSSLKPIIVKQTGAVDNEYYPIYHRSDDNDASNNHHDEDKNENNEIDIDYLDNNDDDLLYEMDEEEHNKFAFVSHGAEKWNLSNTVKPYFMSNDIDDDRNNHQLWIHGTTLSSQEKANNSIIFDVAKELQIGDRIKFKQRSGGNQGIVTKILSNKIIVSTNNDDIILKISNIEQYEIIRIESSNKTKLFKVVTNSEKVQFCRYLKSILPHQPWRCIMEISSFLPQNRWERNVYFEFKEFEDLTQKQYEQKVFGQKSCLKCTFFNALQNKYCSICNTLFDDPLNEINLYKENILELSHRGHPVFPDNKQRHEMYAKQPFLPYIPSTERFHINTIRKHLEIALNENRTLYKYQSHTVLWALGIERAILSKQMLCVGSNDLRFTNNQCDVYCINNDEKTEFIPSNIPRILPPRLLTFGGGIIADDVGLGKTLTILSLIVSHPFNNNITSNSFHPITQKLQYGPNRKTLKCAANLLIAPSHLIEQWKNETIKHFKQNMLKIITITTSSDHKFVTYHDVLKAQIVMVSSQFIGGTHYKFARLQRSGISPMDQHWVDLEANNLKETEIFFELFYWRRIVLDEGHEYLQENHTRNVLLSIQSEFKWYVTATPFPNNCSIGFAAEFLRIKYDDKCGEYYGNMNWRECIDKPFGYTLHCILYNHLLSRHTKDSIMDDNYLPDIDETVQFVQFHPIEKLLYELIQSRRGTKKEDKKLERSVCSGVFNYFLRQNYNYHFRFYYLDWLRHSNEMYLYKLLIINKKYYPLQIGTLQKELKENTKKLKKLKKRKKRLDDKMEEFRTNGIPFDLTIAFPNEQRDKFQRIGQKLRMLQTEINEQNCERIKNIKENEIIQNYDIDTMIEEYKIKFDDKNDGQILLQIVEQYGAKQAAILEFIKKVHDEDINNRIIIFSMFSSTLNAMKKQMDKMGLNGAFCGGNVYSRKNAMASFQSTDCIQTNKRIMLLSLQNAASGADLNSATHVILVDPVPGSSSKAFAEERQAVGRAVRQGMSEKNPTKVIRFVVEGTIEQEIYIRNQKIRNESSIELKHEIAHLKKLFHQRNMSEIEFYMKINHQKNSMKQERKLRKRKNDNDCNDGPPLKRRKIQTISVENKQKELVLPPMIFHCSRCSQFEAFLYELIETQPNNPMTEKAKLLLSSFGSHHK